MNKGIIEKSVADSADMEKINAYSRRTLDENEVYTFTLRLCDNEIDRDLECFSAETLGALAELFKGKTGIFDHSMKSADQKARIYDAYIEKQEGETTSYGEELTALKAKAYMLRSESNAELISEIEAGIKKEVSVSCSVEKNVCSICGKDRRSGECRHISGKKYNGRLCYTRLEGARDAYEFSFVAVPAQRAAGVTKAFKIGKEANMDEIIKTIKSCEGSVELTEKQAQSLGSYIDELKSEALLGEEYKNELKKEVVKLMSLRLPETDRELIASVASVMTAKELKGFRDGLEKRDKAPQPQLLSKSDKKDRKDNSQFRI